MSERIKELFCRPVYERALLSLCFKSVDNYYSINAMISSEDFLRPEHKLIYTIFEVLIKCKVKKFDASLIIAEAKKNEVLPIIGGYEYVDAVVNMDVSVDNLSYYMQKVLDASTKYKLHTQLESSTDKLITNAQSEEITSIEVLSKVESDIMALSMASKFIKEPKEISEGLEETIERRRKNPVTSCGISSGYPIMDKLLDGMPSGTLTVICARPKVGKSTFLSNVAAHVAYREHIPVLYVDTEMPFDQWRDRILSNLSGIDERIIKHGKYSDDEYDRLQKAVAIIKKGKLFHEFMPGYSVDKLVSVYKKYRSKENIGFAIFDYIKEPQSNNANRKEYQLLGDVATALKDLSGELNIPFLAANQINRQDDVADSDRILRYADVLAFFSRMTPEELLKIEDTYKPFHFDYGTHRLSIRESRRGGTTPPEGICFVFKRSVLTIHEARRQIIDYYGADYSRKDEDINDATNSTTDVSNEDSNEFASF